VRELAGVPIITLSESPLIGSAAFVKSLLDYSIAAIAVVVLSPLLLLVALLIKLTSPGPVLFRQQRHGWDGRIITVYKFRSMYVHEEQDGKVTQAHKEDARVTPIGRILRRTSIDELPQLFNVLSGSMSLVGPRPHAVAHNRFYGEKINSYMLRHRVKPGLTGLAQINGFRGETQTVDHMAERVHYDLAYINNWSVWLDFKIMLRTVFVLIGDSVY
jgi:putative colanic acid biosynthesis UDP-glucose lipid carrier transferase